MSTQNEIIELNLSDEDKELLIKMFVGTKLNQASKETFFTELNLTNVYCALYMACINEEVIELLKSAINKQKSHCINYC